MGCATSHEVNAKSQGAGRAAVPIARFQPIPDRYETIEEVQHDLRKAGLESSNLILAVDFTRSNEWTGKRSFGGQCLHAIDPLGRLLNPYQSVISVIGRVLEAFDDDNIIPAFGFGDVSTQGDKCFSFALPDQPSGCQGFDDVLRRYNEITPMLTLHGPTNFAPVIHEAIRIVQRDGGYHIVVIIADGQVTNEDQTRQAIIEASKWPISIIMVGVGDGPWDLMNEFDDKLPARRFDNFQFVEYNAVMQLNKKNPEAGFAIAALMEIPEQYQTIRRLGMIS
uniref:VWFA domain-containing protein n=1 Tax=Globisporangium ultimum (strain ATCC 200006 / CBS 805.95 / DAOM BR144) TaxID=431595 RepID=K3WAJ1_GLOUD